MRLEARGVRKTFEGSRSVTALEGIDLDVREGEFVCIVGPSGCGKSTLLYMLAGLEFPTGGSIVANGEPVTGTGPSRALMFQDGALFPWLSVVANVEFGLKMKSLAPDVREARALQLLRMVHLEPFAHASVHELSGGMRQRVSLAQTALPDGRDRVDGVHPRQDEGEQEQHRLLRHDAARRLIRAAQL